MAPKNQDADATPKTPPPPPLEPNTASEWAKATEGQPLRLPGSGKVAVLRKVPILAMIALAGKSPNTLADEVLRFAAVSANSRTEADQIAEYKKNAKAFMKMAEMVFVSPKLVLDREPDLSANEIGPFHIIDRDYRWIYFQFLQGDDEELDPFRQPRTGTEA